MERKMMEILESWKKNPDKVALVITGSRQIGKTYIIDEFCKTHYKSYCKINFEEEVSREIFQNSTRAMKILDKISINYPDFKLIENDTVLFLDEIQMCPEARSALKPLVFDKRVDVIASGSMLSVSGMRFEDDDDCSWLSTTTEAIEYGEIEESGEMNVRLKESYPHKAFEDRLSKGRKKLSPMGYEIVYRMYPMDFEEYLWAIGISKDITAKIRRMIKECEPFDDMTLNTLTEYHRRYMALGGLPAVVKESLKNPVDWNSIKQLQQSLLSDYRMDIMVYAPPSIRDRVLASMDSMPDMLGKRNKKFVFSKSEERIGSSGFVGWREYENPITWISGAGLAIPCWNVTEPVQPLKSRRDKSFKLYCFETGSLMTMFGSNSSRIDVMKSILEGDTSVNQGGIVENSVADMISTCGYDLFYFERSKEKEGDEVADRIEIDFVISIGGELAAIEVKSGKNRRSGSLKKLRTNPKYTIYPVKRFIKFENGNIFTDELGVEHYPIFAAAFMDELDRSPGLPESLELLPLNL